MRKHIRLFVVFFGNLMLVFCFFWCFIAPYLSARNVITVSSEIDSYPLTIIGAVIGCALCIAATRRTAFIQGLYFLIFIGGICLIIITWTFLSDHEFAYWKLDLVSKSEWNEMTSDLSAWGTNALQKDESKISEIISPEDSIPPRYNKLGLRADDFSGWSQIGLPETGYTNEVVYLLCGNRSRTWGLFIGPQTYIKKRWPHFMLTQVTKKSYFIIGVNN